MFRFAMSALAVCLILSCAVNAASLKEDLDEKALIKRLHTLLEMKKKIATSSRCNLNLLDADDRYCLASTCSYNVLDRIIDVIFMDNENELKIMVYDMSVRLLESVTKKDPEFPVSLDFTVGAKTYTVQVDSVSRMGTRRDLQACVNLS